jgi:AcrR family transcriptional regulator
MRQDDSPLVAADPLDAVLALALPDARHATRRSVLRHALALFNEHGLESTTIDDLRRASGQSVGTIYHHFKNKEGVAAALYFAALDDESRAIAARIGALGERPDGRAVVEALIGAVTHWITDHPALARFIYVAREPVAQGPHAPALMERVRARYAPIDALLAVEVEAGRMRALPEELIPALVLGATEFYARSWLGGRRQVTPAEHAGRLADAAWCSLAAG